MGQMKKSHKTYWGRARKEGKKRWWRVESGKESQEKKRKALE